MLYFSNITVYKSLFPYCMTTQCAVTLLHKYSYILQEEENDKSIWKPLPWHISEQHRAVYKKIINVSETHTEFRWKLHISVNWR
jgi:hypothetical protein